MSETVEQTLDVVRILVSDLFGVEAETVTLRTSRHDVPGWDSLQHVNLIIDVERHFHVQLAESRVSSIQTVGDLVEAIHASQTPVR